MLPRSQSLKKFSRNFPQSASSTLFVVNSRPTRNFKLIVTVPKKTCPLAVDRNRSRRLVTAAYLEITKNNTLKPQEVAVLVRRNLKDVPLAQIKNDLQKLL